MRAGRTQRHRAGADARSHRAHAARLRRASSSARGRRASSLAGGQRLQGCAIEVPGDFSSAAFFIVAGCLAAHDGLTLRGVGVNPTRTGLLTMLRLMGARHRAASRMASGAARSRSPISTCAPARLRGIRVPEELVPLAIDEFPVFFIAAAAAEGETLVTGAAELRVKESDRLAVMAAGLSDARHRLRAAARRDAHPRRRACAAAASTATAITASPWPLRSPA